MNLHGMDGWRYGMALEGLNKESSRCCHLAIVASRLMSLIEIKESFVGIFQLSIWFDLGCGVEQNVDSAHNF